MNELLYFRPVLEVVHSFWFRRLTARPSGFHPENEGSTPFGTVHYATLAPMVERRTCNADVVGSSPTSSLLDGNIARNDVVNV